MTTWRQQTAYPFETRDHSGIDEMLVRRLIETHDHVVGSSYATRQLEKELGAKRQVSIVHVHTLLNDISDVEFDITPEQILLLRDVRAALREYGR